MYVSFALRIAMAECIDESQFAQGVIAEEKFYSEPNKSMEVPKWATDLLRDVALQHGKYRKRPTLIFKKSNYWHGNWRWNGWTGEERITIYAPYHSKKTDTFVFDTGKKMLLHEIAHWLTPGENHNKKFYRKLFRLCQKYEIDKKVMRQEFNYRPKGAKKAYKQIYGSL